MHHHLLKVIKNKGLARPDARRFLFLCSATSEGCPIALFLGDCGALNKD